MGANKKIKISTIAYSAILLVLGCFVLVAVLVYGFGINNQLTQKATRTFPYPAVVIDGVHFITINNLEKNTSAIRKFYENQNFSSLGMDVDFTTADGKKGLKIKERDVLTKMIEDRIIEILANQKGIALTKEVLAQETQRRVASEGAPKNLEENLQRLYGWSLSDFETRIVKPDLYKEKLAASVRESEKGNVAAKQKIEKALAELQAKKDFAEVAKRFSEGESAKNGGELGWFTVEQMLPEISLAAFSLEKGKISEIIESSLGYHIIQLEDRKTENGTDRVQIRQIFVRTKNFTDWLLEQEKEMKILIPLKGMFWNKDGGQVDFNDAELKEFEKNLDQNSANDPLGLF